MAKATQSRKVAVTAVDFSQGIITALTEELGQLLELHTSGVSPDSEEAAEIRERIQAKLDAGDGDEEARKLQKNRWGQLIGELMRGFANPVNPEDETSVWEYDVGPQFMAYVLGPGTEYVSKAEIVRAAVRKAGQVLAGYNAKGLEDLQKVLRTATVAPTGKGFIARLQAQNSQSGLVGSLDRIIVEMKRSKSRRDGKKRVAPPTKKPDPEAERKAKLAEFEAKIADAEARLKAAKESDDFDTAKAVKTELQGLLDERNKLVTAPKPVPEPKAEPKPRQKKQGGKGKPAATVTPEPVAPVASGDGQAEVKALMAFCEGRPEGSAGQMLLARYTSEEITAEKFIDLGRKAGYVK